MWDLPGHTTPKNNHGQESGKDDDGTCNQMVETFRFVPTCEMKLKPRRKMYKPLSIWNDDA